VSKVEQSCLCFWAGSTDGRAGLQTRTWQDLTAEQASVLLPSAHLEAVFQAGDLLVSMWSGLGDLALMLMFLIILKGSSGTPATLVMRAESAIFPFTSDIFPMKIF